MLQLCLALHALAAAWTLNDVSVLLPLPRSYEAHLLLAPTDGDLLPHAVYDDLPRLVVAADPAEIYDKHLRVVAVRFDPCFREGTTTCRRQIRLVWQPVLTIGTADAAAHTFYDLDENAWARLKRELTVIAAPDGDDPLDVHPRIKSEGLGGPHWKALRELITRYAGARNLTRATAMTVNPFGNVWAFVAVEYLEGRRKHALIPRTDKPAQAVMVDLAHLTELNVRLAPAPAAPPAFLATLANSAAVDYPTARAAWRETLRLENPRLTHTGNVDCASCHLAQVTRLQTERRWPDLNARGEPDAYPGTWTNESVNPAFTNRLRAFGYMRDEPVISQRVIHESAEVLAQMRAGN